MAGNDGAAGLIYRATNDVIPKGYWKPSIHMPRWACRLSLEISSVRVERLQEITPNDARSEGCADNAWCRSDWPEKSVRSMPGFYEHKGRDGIVLSNFASLWQSINGPDSWTANPWVWVIEFRKIEA